MRRVKTGIKSGFTSEAPGFDEYADAALIGMALAFPGTSVGRGVGSAIAYGGRKAVATAGKYSFNLVTAGPLDQFARHTAIDGYINKADFVYTTHAIWTAGDRYQSPGNSSQVLPAGSARPGGNTPGVYVPKKGHVTRNGKIKSHSCKKGYYPRWHRHKNGDISAVCVPNSLKGKRIRFE